MFLYFNKTSEVESVNGKYRDLPLKVNEIILSPFDDNLRIFTKDAIYINEDLRKSSKCKKFRNLKIWRKVCWKGVCWQFVTTLP